MSKGLTPYLLALGPIVMMAGFITLPDFQGVSGQEYLEEVKALDMNMTIFKVFIVAIGVLMIFGGLFLLSQDLMANSGKMQQDMLMLSRIGFMFAFTVFYLFFALQLESIFIAQGENNDYAGVAGSGSNFSLAEEIALDTHYMADSIWSSMPIAFGIALILFGIAAVTGNNSPKKPIEWVYGLPILGGLSIISIFWVKDGFAFFLFAMFSAVPIGVMMLAGMLDDESSE